MSFRLRAAIHLCAAMLALSAFNPSSGYQEAGRAGMDAGAASDTGDGGPATKASINGPGGLAMDDEGNLFIVETMESRIRRVDARTGIITTVAGNGEDAFSGDGGPAIEAALDYPTAIAFDASGNLLIAEIAGRIRRVDARTKIINTIAGNGELGDGGTGDGGPAVKASFRRPVGLALDDEGNLFVADDTDHRIRRIDARTGIITTVAGATTAKLGDGGPATRAGLQFPMSVAIDRAGNLFIADYQHQRVRRVDYRTGIITTVAGNGKKDTAGDGGPAVRAGVAYPKSVAVDGYGNLFINTSRGALIRRVDARTGIIDRYAGTGVAGYAGDCGPAARAELNNAAAILIDPAGNLFIAEFVNNRVRRVDAKTKIITTVAGNGLPNRMDALL